ncbi:MAG: hypothetical protein HUK22_07910, partial [Thermoguttaceae bacterium]|nr:hypothetical protein [Thermoguttaceae bacterium]
ERRYQRENREIALRRLRLEIALNVRDLSRIDATGLRDETTFRWFERAARGRICIGAEHFDYPILVAEFFDVYFALGENLQATAVVLRTSTSQIVRLLARNPKCLEKLNRARAARGLGRLKCGD